MFISWHHLSQAKRKCVYGACVVSKGPDQTTLPESLGIIGCSNGEQRPGMIPRACTGWRESADFAHARRHFFAWLGPFNALTIGKAINTRVDSSFCIQTAETNDNVLKSERTRAHVWEDLIEGYLPNLQSKYFTWNGVFLNHLTFTICGFAICFVFWK